MNELYTNSNKKSDFVENGFYDYLAPGMDVFVASAFFTDNDVVNYIIENDCQLKLIVRLGFPTSPDALEKIISNNNIQIRYFTSHTFHPKLYIFGSRNLLFGSANFTRSALLSNQEIMTQIQSSDDRFDQLVNLFGNYWNEAKVLDINVLKLYRKSYNKFLHAKKAVEDFDDEVESNLGHSDFSNIDRNLVKKNKRTVFFDIYKRSYQECVAAFESIKEVYSQYGRKVNPQKVPLRCEIDSFFSYVRDHHAKGESWMSKPVGWNEQSRALLTDHIEAWLKFSYPHFEETIVEHNYPLISKVFSSPSSVDETDFTDIVQALTVLHSFHDRLRFFKDGLEGQKRSFMSSNNGTHVKKVLKYLLFGKGDVIDRMAHCLFDDQLDITQFGKANIQELIGWVGSEGLPVVNGRTTKVLRYFGFDVAQL